MPDALILGDRALFLFFNHAFANPVLDSFFTFITQRNSWIVPGIFAVIFFILREKKHALLVLGLLIVTIAISDPFCVRVLKPFFHRLRPCHPSYFVNGQHLFLEGGRFLLGHKRSFSFPSAHAMNMFSGATLLSLFYPKRAVWFFIIAFLIAFSRIYCGVHYPFDCFAGALIGAGIGSAVYFLHTFVSGWCAMKKILTPNDHWHEQGKYDILKET
jgi:undecaprenyl-diphosphatase